MATDVLAALNAELTLPCGAVLKNRLAKAAMTERVADARGRPTASHERLYRMWSEGGCGMLLTGNVIVDRDHLEAPGNVIIDGNEDAEALAALKRYAAAGKAAGSAIWMQISHAGRQTQKIINPRPKAPSAIALALPGGQFGQPVALTGDEIQGLVKRFAHTAKVARECGFDGAQIHSAHGYLLSSFLSPKTNQRTDEWGGSLENRARFLLEIVRAMRAAVGDDFPVSVKINSADFQKGGFEFGDSLQVVRWLDEAGVDLIEISGGTYEQPRLLGIEGIEKVYDPNVRSTTREREAYFAKFAPEIRGAIGRAKLMVTGGFRTATAMAAALTEDGVDVIGLGRPLCYDTGCAGRLLRGEIPALPKWEDKLVLGSGWLGPNSGSQIVRMINTFGAQGWYYQQLQALAETGKPKQGLGVLGGFIANQRRELRTIKAMRA